MPQITPNTKGGVIRWDSVDWLKGLVPHYVSSTTTNRILGTGLLTMRGIDIFRNPGYIMPGSKGTDPTNISVIDAMIKNGASYGKKAYLVSKGAKLHELALDTSTLTTPTTFPYTIGAQAGTHNAHTTIVGEDIVRYNVGGTEYVFYSFNDATDGDVGRYDLSTTFDDDYMSAVATSGAVLNKSYPHPMIVGDDDILYIANGKDVASFQGSNTTFNSSALDLPQGYVITSFAKTANYLVVFAYKGGSVDSGSYYRSESTAFFWDYISSSFTYAYPLSGNYVNGGFIYKNTVGCFVQGRSPDLYNNKYSKLLLFNGDGFEPMVEFYNVIPGHGGVNVEGDTIFWNSAGVIFQWGSPILGFDKALSKTTEILTGATAEGMLKNFNANTLWGSSGTTTSGGLQSFGGSTPAYNDQSPSFTTPAVTPPLKENAQARVKRVKVFWGEAASGGHSFTLSLYTGRGAVATTIISALTTVTSPTFITDYELNTSGAPLPFFESISLVGAYTAGASSTAVPPYIEAVEVYYEFVNN